MSDDPTIQFKQDNGIEALIQDEDEENTILINPSKITLLDLIKMFGEESTRRGLQYMVSLEKADEKFRNESSKEDMLLALQNMIGVDEPTEGMVELSEEWNGGMEEKGLGIDNT